MDDMWTRAGMHLIARVSGPMKFRFMLQPLVASVFAIRAGLADAKTGKPPYGWALLREPGHRNEMLKNGWKSVGKDSRAISHKTTASNPLDKAENNNFDCARISS